MRASAKRDNTSELLGHLNAYHPSSALSDRFYKVIGTFPSQNSFWCNMQCWSRDHVRERIEVKSSACNIHIGVSDRPV